MAILNWYHQNTSNIVFMLEFDESQVEREFTELVDTLIENANFVPKDNSLLDRLIDERDTYLNAINDFRKDELATRKRIDSLKHTISQFARWGIDCTPVQLARILMSKIDGTDVVFDDNDNDTDDDTEIMEPIGYSEDLRDIEALPNNLQ